MLGLSQTLRKWTALECDPGSRKCFASGVIQREPTDWLRSYCERVAAAWTQRVGQSW